MRDVSKDIKSMRVFKVQDDIERIIKKIDSLENDAETKLPELKDDITKFTNESKIKLIQAQEYLSLLLKEVWK